MSSTHRAQQTWGWASTWQSPHALPPAGEQPDGLSIYRSIAIGAADSTSTTNGRTLALCAPFVVHTTFPPRLGDEEHAFLAIPANGRCVPGIGVRLTQSSARSTRYVPSFHPLHLQPVYCPRHPLQALRAAVPVPVPVPAPVHNSSTFVCVCVCGCVCVCAASLTRHLQMPLRPDAARKGWHRRRSSLGAHSQISTQAGWADGRHLGR